MYAVYVVQMENYTKKGKNNILKHYLNTLAFTIFFFYFLHAASRMDSNFLQQRKSSTCVALAEGNKINFFLLN